jgi:hypothetical protein
MTHNQIGSRNNNGYQIGKQLLTTIGRTNLPGTTQIPRLKGTTQASGAATTTTVAIKSGTIARTTRDQPVDNAHSASDTTQDHTMTATQLPCAQHHDQHLHTQAIGSTGTPTKRNYTNLSANNDDLMSSNVSKPTMDLGEK